MIEDKTVLIDAIAGCGFSSYSFADEMTEAGLAEFSGNQWNEDWSWKKAALEALSITELQALYMRIKST